MAQRGRPKVLDDKLRDIVCGLVGMGFSRWQAARHMGIARTTLYRTAKDDADFAQKLRESELQQEIRPLRRIVEHMPKSWRAAAWILERQKPDLYVRRAPNTVTVADLHGIFGAMMNLLLEGVAGQENRQRVMQNFEKFFECLGGQKRCSPRVRRAIMELELNQQTQAPATADASNEGSTESQDGGPAPEASCEAPSVPECVERASENPEIRGSAEENSVPEHKVGD